MKKINYMIALVFLLSLASAALQGCGKSGMPKPPKSNAEFGWESVGGQATGNNCIFLQGTLTGSVQNLNDVILEIEPVNDDSCVGCPFTPRERERFSAWRLGVTTSNPSFSRTYCPQVTGEGIRWRLVGTNTYSNLPNAISPEVITIFNDKKIPADVQEILELNAQRTLEPNVREAPELHPENNSEPDDVIKLPLK